jgi:hypothetical protein
MPTKQKDGKSSQPFDLSKALAGVNLMLVVPPDQPLQHGEEVIGQMGDHSKRLWDLIAATGDKLRPLKQWAEDLGKQHELDHASGTPNCQAYHEAIGKLEEQATPINERLRLLLRMFWDSVSIETGVMHEKQPLSVRSNWEVVKFMDESTERLQEELRVAIMDALKQHEATSGKAG